MNWELIKVRLIAFVYEGGSMLVSAVVLVLLSPEFEALVAEHFGGTVFGAILVLVLSAAAKHIRNLKVVKEFGSAGVKHLI